MDCSKYNESNTTVNQFLISTWCCYLTLWLFALVKTALFFPLPAVCPALPLVLEWGRVWGRPRFCMWGWRSVSVSNKGSIFSWRGDWVTQCYCNVLQRHTPQNPNTLSPAGWFFIFWVYSLSWYHLFFLLKSRWVINTWFPAVCVLILLFSVLFCLSHISSIPAPPWQTDVT